MKIKHASIFVLLAMLGGCGGPLYQQSPGRSAGIPFDPAEVAWSRDGGPNTIEGSAVLRTQGGEARTCAGRTADLTPYSEYAAARMRILYGSIERGYFSGMQQFIDGPRVANDEYTPAYMAMRREANCDALGNFTFPNLADGRYFVTVLVEWYAGRISQGGWLMQQVEVKGGETKKVVLTP